MSLSAVDHVRRRVPAICKSHIVENKKFGFRSKECGVCNAGTHQISFCFFGDSARVAIVRFACNGIDDGADQTESRFSVEDINPRRRRIGNDKHIRGVDDFPTSNARTVEPESIGKNIFAIFAERGGEMLPRARQIGELEIHEFYLAVFNHFADVGWSFVFGHISGVDG